MGYLYTMTLVWAFSFSLIGEYLAGQVDAWFSVLIRIALAALVFLPFLRFRGISKKLILSLMAIGGIQLGLMYGFYYQSFLLLSVPEVLLFTILTPFYVTLLYDLMKGQFSPWYLVTAFVAVLGAAVIKYSAISSHFLLGFLVVQGANICFAIGQVSYKHLMEKQPNSLPQHHIFGYFYLGALCVALIAFTWLGDSSKLPTSITQWGILTYLGVIASGLGYFIWNRGACKVNAGALAVMNNALVPAGLIVNLVIWNHDVNLPKLLLGGALIAFSLWFNETWVKRKVAQKRQTLT
ncbi:carboxylate/amino acid/amine transporter [Vibrio profundum]|uniref:carboxylate/amino acid/amine transporter n=1 Tax=Vibrio profundum TaxID=2910247 RepID=UPI003D11B44A